MFLAFQYPMEIPGVATMTFLRTAVNAVRKARGEPELSTPDFLRYVREKASLKIDPEMLRRPLNVGFSGGEKKRNEILQMSLHKWRDGRAPQRGPARISITTDAQRRCRVRESGLAPQCRTGYATTS